MDQAPVRLTGQGERAPATRPLTVGVMVLVAAGAGGLPSFSIGANVVVLGSGAVLIWTGMNREPGTPLAEPGTPVAGRGRPPAGRGMRWWLVPAGLLLLVEAANFALGSTYEHPTLSRLADPWLDRYPVRAGAFLGWLAAFRVLVRR